MDSNHNGEHPADAAVAKTAPEDRMLENARQVLIQNLSTDIWNALNADWQSDLELAAAALGRQLVKVQDLPFGENPPIELFLLATKYGLDIQDLPESQMSNIDLLVKTVQARPELFTQLKQVVPPPTMWKVACSLDNFGTCTGSQPTLARQILEIFPSLRTSRSLWKQIIAQFSPKSFDSITSLLQDFASEYITRDPALMKLAFARERGVFQALSEDLLQNKDFVRDLVQTDLYVFCRLPAELQLEYQDLLLEQLAWHQDSLKNTHRRPFLDGNILRIEWFANDLHAELWNRRDIVLGWVQCGGNFAAHFSPTLRRDREIFATVAQHCHYLCKLQSFQLADPVLLRSNKEFMKEVIQYDYALYELIETPELRQDFDLAVLAFAGACSKIFFEDYQRAYPDRQEFLQETYLQLQSKLENHEVFCRSVLTGLSDMDSHFYNLHCGEETTRDWMIQLAHLLNAPVCGKQLRIIQRAANNMRPLTPQ